MRLTLPRMASILCLVRNYPNVQEYVDRAARIGAGMASLQPHEREGIARVVHAETGGHATAAEIRAAWEYLFSLEEGRHG